MSHRIECNACELYVKRGTTCVEAVAYDGDSPVPVTRHFHDVCWDRDKGHLLPDLQISRDVTLRRRQA